MDSTDSDQPLAPFFWPLRLGELPEEPPRDWRVIGHDEGTWLVVSSVGVVESRSPSGQVRFVNSTLPAFERSLALLAPIWRRRSAQDDAGAANDVEALRRGLREIDPEAIADSESWWALILEQMENDLI